MTAIYVRRERFADVMAGRAVGQGDVAVVLGEVGPFVDVLTWGGMRSLVERHRFGELWCPSPRREIRSWRSIHLFGGPLAELHLRPAPARAFVPSWYSLAAVRRALAGYGLRLGKVISRKRYGPAGFRYLGTTWSVRGCFREPRL